MRDIDELKCIVVELETRRLEVLYTKLDNLVGKSQNGPPDGEGDGTIDEATWYAMRDFNKGLFMVLRGAETLRAKLC